MPFIWQCLSAVCSAVIITVEYRCHLSGSVCLLCAVLSSSQWSIDAIYLEVFVCCVQCCHHHSGV